MRLLAITTSYPLSPADGTAPFIRWILHGLARTGFECHVVLPAHPALEWGGVDGSLRLYPYRYVPRAATRLHTWGYGASLVSDAQLRPSTIAVAPLAALSCARLAMRVAARVRPDVVHAHWLLPNGPLGAVVAGLRDLPLVVSLHGSGAYLAERRFVLRRAAGMALRHAAAVTACSSDLGRRAIRLGAPPARTSTIPYGVDTEAFRPADPGERRAERRRWRLDEDDVAVVAVGRLVAKKGFDDLVRAAARAADPRLRVIVAGAGDEGVGLRGLADRLGLGDTVRFPGRLGRSEVAALLRAADVVVVPSVHDDAGNVDGLPNVLLEAMASARPVVATRVGGIPDVVRDCENGLLVPERDPEALAAKIERLRSRPRLAAALGRRARETIETAHTWDAVARRFAAVLKSTLSVR